jgi:hypothetical protein
LQTYASTLGMQGQCANARFIKMRGGIVYNGNSIHPASIVISDGDGRILLSIEGRSADELSSNLERCADLFCLNPPASSDPHSRLDLLERLILRVKSFPVSGSDIRKTRTRELLLGILHEFKMSFNSR